MYKRFRGEPPRKTIPCSCGNILRLVKRKNFTHGRNSSSTTSKVYKCSGCKLQKHVAKSASFGR